jgi:hypothetical protein
LVSSVIAFDYVCVLTGLVMGGGWVGRAHMWQYHRYMRLRSKRFGLSALVCAGLLLGTTGGAAIASPTFRLAIMHMVQGCHVWRTNKVLGPTAKIAIDRGTRVVIRPECPMDFDFKQTAGPKLSLGNPRTVRGSTRTIVFKKPGIYKLTVTNVQQPREVGLETLGETNHLRLTVVVK